MKKITLLLLIISSLSLHAQTTSPRNTADLTNTWFMYFGTHKFSPKWGVHLEAQLRRADVVAKNQQWLLRTGLNYHFSPSTFATVGYCFVETYPYGEFPVKSSFPENRIWEQIQNKQSVGRFEWVNRLRLEQRFSQLPVASGTGFEPGESVYTNRFRVFNRISVPFKGKTIVDKSWYITAYDELFASFGKNVGLNLFDQNRAYVALGYRLPKVGRLEIGYLNQMLVKSDGVRIENNHTLAVGLSSTLDFYKP